MKALEGVKSGDKLIMETTFGDPSIVTVSRVSPKYVFIVFNGVSEHKFRLVDGEQTGNSGYGRSHIRLPEENEIELIRQRQQHLQKCAKLHGIQWSKLDMSLVKTVFDLVELQYEFYMNIKGDYRCQPRQEAKNESSV